jgi:hypothetical protein
MKKLILTWLLAGVCGVSLWAQESSIQDETPIQDETTPEVEPLMRGPIHEAYAEPIASGDEEAFVVPEEPPAAIEEIPPDSKPEGERVTWISGYWSWDSELNDFIWVSGVWRKTPVGRTWSPGRWEAVDDGYQWVAGRWLAEGQIPTEILPTPPETLEQGPTSEAVSDEVFWIPGSWQYRGGRYVWRPGFWSPSHANWVWVPDHYVTAINGCYYVPGFWDFPWENRGRLYAPYAINRRIAYRPGYRFSPSVVVDVSGAFFHLWVRPGYRHYYFGDYYGPQYSSFGFYPWYNYPFGYRSGYDPLFSYYYWNFRRNHHIDLHHHLHHRHDYYQRHADARPPHRHHRGPNQRDRNVLLANAQAGALVHRATETDGRAINLNQREAIRQRVVEQHREQLQTAGQTLADAPAAAGQRREVTRSPADAQMRGAGRNAAGRGSNRQAGALDGVRRTRPNDATARTRDSRAVQPRAAQSRVATPTARGQAADRATANDRPDARQRSPEGVTRNRAGAQPGQSPGRVDVFRRRPGDVVEGIRGETSGQPGSGRPARANRQVPPAPGPRATAPRGPAGRAVSPEARPAARPPGQAVPGPQNARPVPTARPRATTVPAPSASRAIPVPTNRSFNASGGPPAAGRAIRSAPRPAPQVSRPAPQVSRPAPQVSRPAPSVRQAPQRGPSPSARSQQIQRSLNRRNASGPRGGN